MKIRGIQVEQGLKIKSVGLNKKERKIIGDAMRRIKYERKRDDRQPLSYQLKLPDN